MLLSLGRFHFSSLGQGLKWFPQEGAGVDAVVSLRGNLCRPSTFISSRNSFVSFSRDPCSPMLGLTEHSIVPAWRPNICRRVFNGQRACNFAEKIWSRKKRLPVCLCQGSGLWLWYFSLIYIREELHCNQNPFLEEAMSKQTVSFFHLAVWHSNVMVSIWKLLHHSCDVNPFVFYDVSIFQISFLQLFARPLLQR